MTKRCIVSCVHATGSTHYHKYGDRLERSFREHGFDGTVKIWRDEWPPGAPPHKERHYAFKAYAVAWAMEHGFDKVMWLDSSCYCVADAGPVWEEIEKREVYVVACYETVEPLGEWISDDALSHFGRTRDDAMKIRLSGGCVVGLDLCRVQARQFFAKWMELARDTDLFLASYSKFRPDRNRSLLHEVRTDRILSEDPRVKGHRSDEACFSLMLEDMGIEQASLKDFNQCILSGYDLA